MLDAAGLKDSDVSRINILVMEIFSKQDCLQLIVTNARNSGGTWIFNTGKKVPADNINDNGKDCLAWDQSNEEYVGIACDDESYNVVCIVRPEISALNA